MNEETKKNKYIYGKTNNSFKFDFIKENINFVCLDLEGINNFFKDKHKNKNIIIDSLGDINK